MRLAGYLCNRLLACALRALGFDLRKLHVSSVRPLHSGGCIVILEPIDDPDYGIASKHHALTRPAP